MSDLIFDVLFSISSPFFELETYTSTYIFFTFHVEPCGRTAAKNQSAAKWPYFAAFPGAKMCRKKKMMSRPRRQTGSPKPL